MVFNYLKKIIFSSSWIDLTLEDTLLIAYYLLFWKQIPILLDTIFTTCLWVSGRWRPEPPDQLLFFEKAVPEVRFSELCGGFGLGVFIVFIHNIILVILQMKKGNGFFNNELNTFHLWIYGVRHIINKHSKSRRENPATIWVTLSD